MEASVNGKNVGMHKRRLRESRVVILVGIFVAVVLLVLILTVVLNKDDNRTIEPNSNYGVLISSQLYWNEYIGKVSAEPSLRFKDFAYTLVDPQDLSSLKNNYYDTVNDTDLLVDELAVASVIRLGSDWAKYLNTGDTTYFGDVVSGSPAEEKIEALTAPHTQISFQTMKIGEIRKGTDDFYYIITQENYTLAANGELAPRDSVFIYKLKPVDDKFLVMDFEELPSA